MEKRQKPSLHSDWIDPDASFIVDRLQKAGFNTYLVGGCVRDLLAGIHPKDFDIATSASPEQVRKLIRGSYIIGKRFPLVLVKRGNRQFEVATFRRNALPEEMEGNDQSFVDNFYGSPQEDAQRRDFTVNGLFYDPVHDELIDYVEGIKDIENGYIKMIGSPEQRLKEDPIRILRAIRLSHKLRFSIEETLRLAIETHSQELTRSILPRKREEYFKLMRLDDPSLVFKELHDLKILEYIMPSLAYLWDQDNNAAILMHYLARTHELSIDPANTTQLMIPIVLALSKIFDLPKKTWVSPIKPSSKAAFHAKKISPQPQSDEPNVDNNVEAEASNPVSLDLPNDESSDLSREIEGLSAMSSAPISMTENAVEQTTFSPLVSNDPPITNQSMKLVDNLFKIEWGLFKTEQQALYEALQLLDQMQPIENLFKRGNRRLKNFFSRDNTYLALIMAKADYLFTGEQWLKIENLLKQMNQKQ